MITEDIASLLVPSGQPELAFHQGTILTWDSQTGENVVDVLGTPVPNLPTLNLSDTLTLAAGMQVMVMRYRSTMFILGRLTVPNTPSFFSGAMPDQPAPFYPVNTDTALQTNTVGGGFTSKLVGGYVINHPSVEFGTRAIVTGAAAVGSWRVQWYTAHPGSGASPAGGTLMGDAAGLTVGAYVTSRTYTWPPGMRGELVYVSFEVALTAGTGGVDWVSAVPTYFVGRV